MSGKFLVPCLRLFTAALGDSQNRELSSTHMHHKRSLRSCGWREKVVRSQNNIFFRNGKKQKGNKVFSVGTSKIW